MATIRIPEQNETLVEKESIRSFLAPFGIHYDRWPVAGRIGAEASQEEILQAYDPEIQELKARGGYVTADVIDVTPDVPNLQVMLDRFNKEHTHAEDEVRFIVKGRGIFFIHPEASAPDDSASAPDAEGATHGDDRFGVPALAGAGKTSANTMTSEILNTPQQASASPAEAGTPNLRDRATRPVFSIEVEEGDLINVPAGTKHWFDLCKDRTIRAIRLFREKAGWTPSYTESQIAASFEPVCFGPNYLGADKPRIAPGVIVA